MKVEAACQQQRKGLIKSSTIVLLAFATAYFARIIEALGVPAAINFLHFATVPLACGIALVKARSKSQRQLTIVQEILLGLLIFFILMCASGLLNNAGLINVVLNYLMLTEPFLLIVAIACIPMSLTSTEKLHCWLVRFGFINLLLALLQRFVLNLHLQEGLEDNIKGVFLNQGSGHVVGASVSLTFGTYYLCIAKERPLWLRASVFIATIVHVLVSDAKQVLAVFLVALVLLFCTKLKDITEFVKYSIGAILAVFIAVWLANNGFLAWSVDMTLEGMKLKLVGFSIIPSFYHSPLNPLLGLGPGHTIGRLGGWMLRDYWDLLSPLGATQLSVSEAVWSVVGASWFGDKSSMFSPFFGWAGIWGDLGLLGLGAYFYLAFLVWCRLCSDDLSRFFLLTIFVFGLIFTQIEEPGYMLFMAILVGLQWQTNRLRRLS
ncbi:hypothetical protein [Chroococcidiopsis sp. CCNUC1]|jgi:hypothetical protein|uniref:hypothetical protein n=1 Tax=Chroococcidiopsis sp. CCNUC1 TaxID=2653189 RepID=UPI000D0678C5|nr:hypothetical protein [Chroococcidiopsis sp. CCNUC1]PSB43669.1 hypothetical protein C7B80_23360 [Cyanosarcina cf. burmensis CCALA 770]URD51005.1 hypothetical protein M5J74_03245 [Chroococcidiopsis sp. CCNUC1]